MHCLIHYVNCYYIYLISAMCSIICLIYYRVVVKINLYQCHCQCQYNLLKFCQPSPPKKNGGNARGNEATHFLVGFGGFPRTFSKENIYEYLNNIDIGARRGWGQE